MNKKHLLKSLAVAAVVAMASANASAEVLAAVAAVGDHRIDFLTGSMIPGAKTALFKHAGGPLTATYTAECAVATPATPAPVPPGAPVAGVRVEFVVRDAQDKDMGVLSPGMPTLCSSSGETGLRNRASHAVTGVATLPPGVYRVQVLGNISNVRTATALMGARSLVVSR